MIFQKREGGKKKSCLSFKDLSKDLIADALVRSTTTKA